MSEEFKEKILKGTEEIYAGRLHWSNIRMAIKHLQFLGYKIDFSEGDGFFQKSFLIKGEVDAINQLKRIFEDVT